MIIDYPPPAAERIPATMLAAPNRMKQPNMTAAPCRQLIRPVSIIKPTAATAITATTVATVPSSVPCSQLTASTIAPDPAGSAGIAAKAGPDIMIRQAIRPAPRIFVRCKESIPRICFDLQMCHSIATCATAFSEVSADHATDILAQGKAPKVIDSALPRQAALVAKPYRAIPHQKHQWHSTGAPAKTICRCKHQMAETFNNVPRK